MEVDAGAVTPLKHIGLSMGPSGNEERKTYLDQIAREILVCTRCDLHKYRLHAVPGEGPLGAQIMLIGEAPGRQEDITGRPFIGRSGKVLDEIIKQAGLVRGKLFITSIVKCRPPGNREPLKQEQQTCIQAHLNRQIEVINPQVLALLGRVAISALLGKKSVEEARKKMVVRNRMVVFSTYHPAAAGRSTTAYREMAQDFKKLEGSLG